MNWPQLLQSVVTALVIAGIFALFRLFRDIDRLKVEHKYEMEKIRAQVEPVITWWQKTSMDALRIAVNPTSERLTYLAEKYAAFVTGKGQISAQEKQELVDGLRYVMNNTDDAGKRSSASMSLRFIEAREGITAHKRAAGNH